MGILPPPLTDVDGDGQITCHDLKILLANWNRRPLEEKADLNADGLVNSLDFGLLLKKSACEE